MSTQRDNSYDDLLGVLGGGVCLVVSYFDAAWGAFWFIAGALLIVWSAVSFMRRKSRR